jgi:2-polyprenyl-3-methyl-5-hydroxy-6-metoxy-1,4-benzoquinol methylase
LLDTNSILDPYPRLTFAKCPRCGTVFQLDFTVPQYESYNASSASVKFYVEQGAGLESLVLPVCIARTRPIQSYLEVGCGFGFGLDFARHSFGWQVRGIDPSPIADQGRRIFGLPIEHRYLTQREAGGATYDAIAALEVLEHVDAPNGFLNILRDNLSPEGILILSTPDADYIEFGVEKPGLLSVLTPGYHAVLYTADSIKLALQKAGFSDVQVVVRGATLLAVAGTGASRISLDKAFDPNLYRAYLETRSSAAEPGSILEVGFTFRLFKHLVNNGLYADAEAVMPRLAEILMRRDGIDVLDPHRLLATEARPCSFEDFVSRLPACLAGVLFFNGMLRLNHHEDRAGALAYFYATHLMAGIFRKAMHDFGIDDGETADLERSARDHVKLVLGWMSQ